MITAADVITKLKAMPATPFKFVGDAGDFLAAADQLKVSPSIFVLPSAKRPGPDKMLTGVISQHVTKQFSLVIGIQGAKVGAAGGAAVAEIDAMEDLLVDYLLGWQPEGLVDPFIYAGGRMLGLDVQKQVMFWGSDFAAGYHLRK